MSADNELSAASLKGALSSLSLSLLSASVRSAIMHHFFRSFSFRFFSFKSTICHWCSWDIRCTSFSESTRYSIPFSFLIFPLRFICWRKRAFVFHEQSDMELGQGQPRPKPLPVVSNLFLNNRKIVNYIRTCICMLYVQSTYTSIVQCYDLY